MKMFQTENLRAVPGVPQHRIGCAGQDDEDVVPGQDSAERLGVLRRDEFILSL